MMKVKALINLKTVDGKKVGPFLQGQTFELDDNLARKWVDSAMVEPVIDPVPAEVVEPAAVEVADPAPGAADAQEERPRGRRSRVE
jgi:hypothetical protein